MASRTGNLLRNSVALAAGLLLALLMGEIVTRIVAGPPAWFFFSGSFRERRITGDIEYHVSDELRRVSCDSQGEAGDSRPRIAVIGDSFVFGLGVSDCHDFVGLLNSRQDAVHFENFGLIGAGPLQYQLVARDLVDDAYDGALLVFYGNDFPSFPSLASEQSLLGLLADHSSLFALIRKAKRRYQVKERAREINETQLDDLPIEVFNNVAAMVKGPTPEYARLCVDPGDAQIDDFEVRFETILQALERHISREDIVVTMVPQGSVLSPELRRFIVDLGGDVGPFGERGTAYAAVERLAAEHGLRFIDTFDTFAKQGDAAYWHDDFHWNEVGHEQMAELVGRAYRADGRFSATRPPLLPEGDGGLSADLPDEKMRE